MVCSSLESVNHDLQIAFLVYDSRSGSTFLSKQISECLPRVIVTPEIGFDLLLEYGEQGLRNKGWEWFVDRMLKGHEFRNLNMTKSEILSALGKNLKSVQLESGIRNIIHAWVKKQGKEIAAINWVVIKNGSHAKYWRQILNLFSFKAYFIYIVRDPRAVISSKYKTPRPHYPYENMAWGGLILSCLRWKLYYKNMARAEKNGGVVLRICYENFIADMQNGLTQIANFLGINDDTIIDGCESRHTYVLPEKEIGIHKLALSSKPVSNRIEAWREELDASNIRKIEALCFNEMIDCGYSLLYQDGYVKKLMMILLSIPNMLYSILRHIFLKIQHM